MALSVDTSMLSLNSKYQPYQLQNQLNESLKKLSSGVKINSATKDAVKLDLSSQLVAQVGRIGDNLNNERELVQTATTGLQKTAGILGAMYTIASTAADAANTEVDWQQLQDNMANLQYEARTVAHTMSMGRSSFVNSVSDDSLYSESMDTESIGQFSFLDMTPSELGSQEISNTYGKILQPISVAPDESLSDVKRLPDSGCLHLAGLSNGADFRQTIGVGTGSSSDYSAFQIADQVNATEMETGIQADARTQAILKIDLPETQKNTDVSFGLYSGEVEGEESIPRISETLSSAEDLSPLATAINQYTESTGVKAQLGTDKDHLRLLQEEGRNIQLRNVELDAGAQMEVTGLDYAGTPRLSNSMEDGGGMLIQGAVRFTSDNPFEAQFRAGTQETDPLLDGFFNSDAEGDAEQRSSLESIDDISLRSPEEGYQALQTLEAAISQVEQMGQDVGILQQSLQSDMTLQSGMGIADTQEANLLADRLHYNMLQQSDLSMAAQINVDPQRAYELLY